MRAKACLHVTFHTVCDGFSHDGLAFTALLLCYIVRGGREDLHYNKTKTPMAAANSTTTWTSVGAAPELAQVGTGAPHRSVLQPEAAVYMPPLIPLRYETNLQPISEGSFAGLEGGHP